MRRATLAVGRILLALPFLPLLRDVAVEGSRGVVMVVGIRFAAEASQPAFPQRKW